VDIRSPTGIHACVFSFDTFLQSMFVEEQKGSTYVRKGRIQQSAISGAKTKAIHMRPFLDAAFSLSWRSKSTQSSIVKSDIYIKNT
jgi:hypothetical protein